MIYTKNDDVKQFGAENGYGNQYNDILLKWLRDFFNVSNKSLPDLLNRYNKAWGEVMQPAAQHAVAFVEGTVPTLWSASSSTQSTYIDSDGYIKTNPTGGMRFEYHPLSHEFQGILIEAGSRNFLARSAEFENAYYTKNAVSVTANQTTSPANTTTADLLQEDNTNAAHSVSRAAVTTASVQNVVVYVFAKAYTGGDTRYLKITVNGTAYTATANGVFNLATGATDTDGSTAVEALTTEFMDGWWKCSLVTLADTVGNIDVSIGIVDTFDPTASSYQGDNTSGVYLWGGQVELRRYPSSYIPTTSGAVQRGSDSMTILGGNFSGLFNATEGTIVTEVRNIYNYTGKYLSVSNGTANEGFYLERSGTDTKITIVDDSVNQFTETVAGNESDSTVRMALAYKLDDCQAAVNGAEGTTDTSVTLPTTVVLIAADATAGLSYYFRRFRYYNTRRTDLDLLTTI